MCSVRGTRRINTRGALQKAYLIFDLMFFFGRSLKDPGFNSYVACFFSPLISRDVFFQPHDSTSSFILINPSLEGSFFFFHPYSWSFSYHSFHSQIFSSLTYLHNNTFKISVEIIRWDDKIYKGGWKTKTRRRKESAWVHS